VPLYYPTIRGAKKKIFGLETGETLWHQEGEEELSTFTWTEEFMEKLLNRIKSHAPAGPTKRRKILWKGGRKRMLCDDNFSGEK